MTARELLDELDGLGVKLESRGDRLHVVAPREVLTADLVDRLNAHKSEIMDAIRRHPSGYGVAEIDRFFSIAEPHPDGGWTDPAERDVVNMIRSMRPLTDDEIRDARFVREWNRAAFHREKKKRLDISPLT